MTIEELGFISEMTTENILFYENKGLISPLISGSNYRYYSQEDAQALLKIKLLRRAQIPVEVIRQIQAGGRDLQHEMSDKIELLERVLADTQRGTLELCREIKASGTNYQQLDAPTFIERIKADIPGGSGYFSPRSDELPTVANPWRRYFARALDLTIYTTIWFAVFFLVLRWNPATNGFLQLFNTFLSCGTMLLIEPLLLSKLGTTPGKWLFGLELYALQGNKLTYSAAFTRTRLLFQDGLGYFIPIYSIYRHYKSYVACRDHEMLPWDENIYYILKDKKPIRIIAVILANILILLLIVAISLQAVMPRIQGDLSAEEFTRNFNDLLDYHGINYGMHLSADGQWIEDPYDGTAITLMLMSPPLPDFDIIETDGIVTRISFSLSAEDSGTILDNYGAIIILAIRSYAGAQKGVNFLNHTTVLPDVRTSFSSFSHTVAGITIQNDVSYEGYQKLGTVTLSPIDGEQQSFHLEFSMDKTG